METPPDLPEIAAHFQFEGQFLDAIPHAGGHIHDSFLVRCRIESGQIRLYLLQRLNTHVFRDPQALMENVARVSAHLQRKVLLAGGDPERQALALIPTQDGEPYLRTPAGAYWRAYHYIRDAPSYERAQSPEHVYQAGLAIGRFQDWLQDLPPRLLHATIPDFHHTPRRFQAFVQAVAQDTCQRAPLVETEIAFARARGARAAALVEAQANGELPLRVTHNDTKLNNILIDAHSGRGLCLVDLDTVMPGLAAYDFGDAVRSVANPTPEDARDLSAVTLDLALFERFTHGYLETARGFLTGSEVESLPLACWMMTYECGVRFLTDFLRGDVYFKTRRPQHNLDRCRVQFKLLEALEQNFEKMVRIVARYR